MSGKSIPIIPLWRATIKVLVQASSQSEAMEKIGTAAEPFFDWGYVHTGNQTRAYPAPTQVGTDYVTLKNQVEEEDSPLADESLEDQIKERQREYEQLFDRV